MTSPMPEQRRALRKASDRTVHTVAPPPGDPSIAEPARRPDEVAPRPSKEKRVKLAVKVPKSLRGTLREEAERRGMTVDELVTILLGDRITR